LIGAHRFVSFCKPCLLVLRNCESLGINAMCQVSEWLPKAEISKYRSSS